MKKIYLYLLLNLIAWSSFAQSPRTYATGDIELALRKLQVLGSALYIAAHPDDENTAMIAYLANDQLLRTAYLSLTRGDGGQNLIGAEQRELLGLIRTQELLQARRTDGGEQFFTRANDFGFSKTPQETFEIWGKEKVLADMVWVIRNYRPDVLITRFPPTAEAGHGHHTASAMLAEEAFDASGDPNRFPEQLQYVQPWQPKRLLWNAFSRRQGQFRAEAPDSLKDKSIQVPLSSFNPFLGKSHTVMAAESRSMHRSQGFGSAKRREERWDNLALVKGAAMAKPDMFDGIDRTWNRVKGAQQVAQWLKEAEDKFEPQQPAAIVPLLVQASVALENLIAQKPDPETLFWALFKLQELKTVIQACLGLWFEVNADSYTATVGDNLKLTAEVFLPYNLPVSIEKIEVFNAQLGALMSFDTDMPRTLETGKQALWSQNLTIPEGLPTNQPYWLKEKATEGLFTVSNPTEIGLPENQPPLEAQFLFRIGDQLFSFVRPVTYKWTKPDEGELYRPLEITPELMVNTETDVYMFAGNTTETITVKVVAGRSNISGMVRLDLSQEWQVEPAEASFTLDKRLATQTIQFQVKPPAKAEAFQASLLYQLSGESQTKTAQGLLRIEYPHIPRQVVFPTTKLLFDKLEVKIAGKNIGYIEGAGDEIPQHLRQLGYVLTMLSDEDLEKGNLNGFDAIVVGVRAFNLEERRLGFVQAKLWEYVQQGGRLVIQYQTSFGQNVEQLGPYPFKITRDRVTEERAEVKFLLPDHPLLNYPNKISADDFEGWVQERGLYFAGDWDNQYQAPLSMHDKGEKDLAGSLIVAPYGKGMVVYTGLSFFRQLPAGVPGAYRLFVNLLSK